MVESMSWSHQNLKENGVLPHLLRIDQLPQHLQLESQLQINHRGDGQRMNYNNSLTLFFFCPQQPAGGFLMEVSSLRHSNCIPPSCKKKKKNLPVDDVVLHFLFLSWLQQWFFISYSFLACSIAAMVRAICSVSQETAVDGQTLTVHPGNFFLCIGLVLLTYIMQGVQVNS